MTDPCFGDNYYPSKEKEQARGLPVKIRSNNEPLISSYFVSVCSDQKMFIKESGRCRTVGSFLAASISSGAHRL
jgi:hypothetical protein